MAVPEGTPRPGVGGTLFFCGWQMPEGLAWLRPTSWVQLFALAGRAGWRGRGRSSQSGPALPWGRWSGRTCCPEVVGVGANGRQVVLCRSRWGR